MKIIRRHSEVGEVQPGELYIADLKALGVTTTPAFQIAFCGRDGAICECYTEAEAKWLAGLIEAAGPKKD
jgi:hypothetical protein